MSVGYPVTAADINNRAGALVVAVWEDLEAIRRMKLWLDDAAHTDTYLNNLAGGGITGTASSGDVKLLRDSFADLAGTSGLWAVAHGTFAPSGASNYFTNAKNLAGVTYAG